MVRGVAASRVDKRGADHKKKRWRERLGRKPLEFRGDPMESRELRMEAASTPDRDVPGTDSMTAHTQEVFDRAPDSPMSAEHTDV